MNVSLHYVTLVFKCCVVGFQMQADTLVMHVILKTSYISKL